MGDYEKKVSGGNFPPLSDQFIEKVSTLALLGGRHFFVELPLKLFNSGTFVVEHLHKGQNIIIIGFAQNHLTIHHP